MKKAVLLLTLSIMFAGYFIACGETGSLFNRVYDYNSIVITKVIDGDTVELESRERVRLIGIDTPESRFNRKAERDSSRSKKDIKTILAMGKRATEFTKSIAEGKRVMLEFDAERKDRYGRLLAYIYLPDGKMLNAELIRSGYAQVYTFPQNVRYVDMFLRLQKEARENERGFWKP